MTNKHLVIMVGPPGSGKSTWSKNLKDQGYSYINQDSQGRQHLEMFDAAIKQGANVVVDRMGFTKQQRSRYLDIAKAAGYSTEIVILYQPYSVCFQRCMNRQGHETIKDETNARGALNLFFTKYEPVEMTEADKVVKVWPEGDKPSGIVCDLDGTLCLVEHRRHFVRSDKPLAEGEKFKANWKGFFDAMTEDEVNRPVAELLHTLNGSHCVVLCSGRPDSYKRDTVAWLKKNDIKYDDLFMRNRADHRDDSLVKEIILDFEILTRYKPYFMLDDRDRVVEMWRKRGYTCFQVAEGNF